MRSCTGCNARDVQSSLARFTLVVGRLVWDGGRRRPGRGAYLHLRPDCVEAFARRKPFLRSLRASVPRAERERFVAERSLS
ncbi:MAG: DUF448 domain-containing protein [Candidatus Binatia bacterium]